MVSTSVSDSPSNAASTFKDLGLGMWAKGFLVVRGVSSLIAPSSGDAVRDGVVKSGEDVVESRFVFMDCRLVLENITGVE